MKSCPRCNRTYPDDTLAFCLADGALLSAPFDPQATQHLPPLKNTNESPTEVLPAYSPNPPQPKYRSRSNFIYIAVLVVALFIAGGIAMSLRSESQKPNSVKESVTPTPVNVPSPSPIPSLNPDKSSMKVEATPTPENKPDLSYLTGTYYLYPLENPSGDSVGTMTLTVHKGNDIFAQGPDWKGTGKVDGKQGYYDWKFEDGKYGRTTVLINDDGTLQGRVFGSGLDWWYLARRQK